MSRITYDVFSFLSGGIQNCRAHFRHTYDQILFATIYRVRRVGTSHFRIIPRAVLPESTGPVHLAFWLGSPPTVRHICHVSPHLLSEVLCRIVT